MDKIKEVQSLGDSYKEYRSGAVRKQIIKIEEKVKKEGIWSNSVEDIRNYKALEKQRSKLLQTEEVI